MGSNFLHLHDVVIDIFSFILSLVLKRRSNVSISVINQWKIKTKILCSSWSCKISIKARIKLFLRGKTTVVVCAITSILNLVSNEKSARSSNQAGLNDFILQRAKQVKHVTMYHKQNFTKRGYSIGFIIQSLTYLKIIINVEIVRLLLDSELYLIKLEVLVYFTHKVTLLYHSFTLLKLFRKNNFWKYFSIFTLICWRKAVDFE